MKDALQVFWRQCRRCPTSKVNGLDVLTFQVMCLQFYFFQDGIDEFIFFLKRSGKMEIAVMTGLSAKRNMHIDTGHACKHIKIWYWQTLKQIGRWNLLLLTHYVQGISNDYDDRIGVCRSCPVVQATSFLSR